MAGPVEGRAGPVQVEGRAGPGGGKGRSRWREGHAGPGGGKGISRRDVGHSQEFLFIEGEGNNEQREQGNFFFQTPHYPYSGYQ